MRFSAVGKKYYGRISKNGLSKLFTNYYKNNPSGFDWNINLENEEILGPNNMILPNTLRKILLYYVESASIIIQEVDELKESDVLQYNIEECYVDIWR